MVIMHAEQQQQEHKEGKHSCPSKGVHQGTLSQSVISL